MRFTFSLLALSLALTQVSVQAFAPSSQVRVATMTSRTALNYIKQDRVEETTEDGLPSFEQLTTDDFSDQAYHAKILIDLLEREPETLEEVRRQILLQELLTAQLSHEDGIQGFLTSYLTQAEGSLADKPMPKILTKVFRRVDILKVAQFVCKSTILTFWKMFHEKSFHLISQYFSFIHDRHLTTKVSNIFYNMCRQYYNHMLSDFT